MTRKSMIFEENNIRDDQYFLKNVKGHRGARLTINHLLKLRQIREKKKLRKLQDLKLYTIMYNTGEQGGGF